MSLKSPEKVLIANVLTFISSVSIKEADIDTESVQVGIQCLAESFNLNAELLSKLSITSHSLLDIFRAGMQALEIKMPDDSSSSCTISSVEITDPVIKEHPEMWQKWLNKLSGKGYFKGTEKGTPEYEVRVVKALGKFKEKFASKDEFSVLTTEERELEAEVFKMKGNDAISTKDYDDAVAHYEKALSLSSNGPKSHIYHANLAAALTHLKKYDQVVQHCEDAVSLNPSYAKAFSRMGHGHYCLNDYDAAIQSYRRGLEVDPSNTACLEGVEVAETAQTQEAEASTRAMPNTAGMPSGMPDLSGLTAMMGGGSGAGGNTGGGMPDLSGLAAMMGGGSGGGMPDLSGLMQNPAMRDMAAGMMQNPQMMEMAKNMMQNPSMMANMMAGMNGGGSAQQAPDVEELLPEE